MKVGGTSSYAVAQAAARAQAAAPEKPQRSALSIADRFTGQALRTALVDPAEQQRARCDRKACEVPVRRGADGVFRAPEGTPMAQVMLDNGRAAFVDPNHNVYCFAEFSGGADLRTRGPVALPDRVRFGKARFSDADVRELERLASGRSRPLAFPLPIELI